MRYCLGTQRLVSQHGKFQIAKARWVSDDFDLDDLAVSQGEAYCAREAAARGSSDTLAVQSIIDAGESACFDEEW